MLSKPAAWYWRKSIKRKTGIFLYSEFEEFYRMTTKHSNSIAHSQELGAPSQTRLIGPTVQVWWSSFNTPSGRISDIHHFFSKYAACIWQICFIDPELFTAIVNIWTKFSADELPWFRAQAVDNVIRLRWNQSNLGGIVHENGRSQIDCKRIQKIGNNQRGVVIARRIKGDCLNSAL